MPSNDEMREAAAKMVSDKIDAYLSGSSGIFDFWKRRTTAYLTMVTEMLAEGDKASWISNQVAFALTSYQELEQVCRTWRDGTQTPGMMAPGTQSATQGGGTLTFEVSEQSGVAGPVVIGSVYERELAAVELEALTLAEAEDAIAAEFIQKHVLNGLLALSVRVDDARVGRGGLADGTYSGRVQVRDGDASVVRAILNVRVRKEE